MGRKKKDTSWREKHGLPAVPVLCVGFQFPSLKSRSHVYIKTLNQVPSPVRDCPDATNEVFIITQSTTPLLKVMGG